MNLYMINHIFNVVEHLKIMVNYIKIHGQFNEVTLLVNEFQQLYIH
jgi:hypothetical protein